MINPTRPPGPPTADELRRRATAVRAELEASSVALTAAIGDWANVVENLATLAKATDVGHLDWDDIVNQFKLADLNYATMAIIEIHTLCSRALGA